MTRLAIETFVNGRGNVLYRALAHPVGAERLAALLDRLAASGPVALYDPAALAGQVAALAPLERLTLAGLYGQNVEDIGGTRLGHVVRPVTEIGASGAAAVLVLGFDAATQAALVARFTGARVVTLDEARLPDEFLTVPGRYLDPLNFATGLAFFRDAEGLSTRLVTADYWGGYGAGAPRRVFCRLFGAEGAVLAEWWEDLAGSGAVLSLDSRAVRARFGLPEFCGQLFLHVVGAAGHDILKYALDVIGTGRRDLSCTHDANPWPSDWYAGLPAPRPDERVVLWLQNSHARPIPPGSIRLAPMGEDGAAVAYPDAIPPFATVEVDTRALLPGLAWPRQIEVEGGRHMVRPRYEVVRGGLRHVAHVNVERSDLQPEPALASLSALGKGFILPFPVLPSGTWRTTVLPTPMARSQADLPLRLSLYRADGTLAGTRFLGRLPRDHAVAVALDELGADAPGFVGHAELTYDFADGGGADGWLHALFRWERRDGAHAAESSFGSHVFNTALVWRNEPQSYSGPPPGLSTRLFLRLGEPETGTLCCLIYPASAPWAAASDTALMLHDAAGREIARRTLRIPCSGSALWRPAEMFTADEIAAAPGGYVLIRDTTCRLFGYHGLERPDGAFCLDHMFGF